MDHIVFSAIVYLVSLVIALWVAGALYFDAAGARWYGWLLVGLWAAAVAAIFRWAPERSEAALAIFLLFLLCWWWWRSLKPSQERNWDPNFSQPATVTCAGDQITVENVRNTEYRTITDYTPRYETRRYRLSRMRRVDVLILFWGSPWMSHPLFVFDFGEDGRLCLSIEVRYRVGQKYSFMKSLYRQQELMYVVSDERDAILRRTKCLEGHDMYLYRVIGDQLEMRQFFFEYTNRINQLAKSPRWYHGVTANCTTGIYAQGRGRIKWDWRMLFNGSLDRFFYDRGRLDTTQPFEQLKAASRVNEIANRAPVEGFGDFLRRELPGYRAARDVIDP